MCQVNFFDNLNGTSPGGGNPPGHLRRYDENSAGLSGIDPEKIMNIYFSCSITGGRQDQHAYREIVDYLISCGYKVLTAQLADPDIIRTEGSLAADLVYQRDVNWIRECDAMVAEVSTPSHGVGYEIALALQLGKPVCCCFKSGKRVSKMILGNPDMNLKLKAYQDLEEAVKYIGRFLQSVER